MGLSVYPSMTLQSLLDGTVGYGWNAHTFGHGLGDRRKGCARRKGGEKYMGAISQRTLCDVTRNVTITFWKLETTEEI